MSGPEGGLGHTVVLPHVTPGLVDVSRVNGEHGTVALEVVEGGPGQIRLVAVPAGPLRLVVVHGAPEVVGRPLDVVGVETRRGVVRVTGVPALSPGPEVPLVRVDLRRPLRGPGGRGEMVGGSRKAPLGGLTEGAGR